MAPNTLTVLARLGTMFERTARVRDDAELNEVLEDVARAIGDVLGYRSVVINIYRYAFDDMLTAAAVGSDDSVRKLVGTISPRDTWTPLLTERFRRREGAYFVPDGEFDWDALGVDTYVPDIEPSDDPNAWLPGDALFVPLRDARQQLLGVVSVDEPETCLRPTDERARRAGDDLQARRARAADRPGHGQRPGAPAHARAGAGGLVAAGRGERRGRRAPGRLRRHPPRARLREGADRDRRRSDPPTDHARVLGLGPRVRGARPRRQPRPTWRGCSARTTRSPGATCCPPRSPRTGSGSTTSRTARSSTGAGRTPGRATG